MIPLPIIGLSLFAGATFLTTKIIDHLWPEPELDDDELYQQAVQTASDTVTENDIRRVMQHLGRKSAEARQHRDAEQG